MEYCRVAERMKAACPILKPGNLNIEFSNLEAEMDMIAKLLVKCCNYYIMNGDADGLKYLSEIYAVKTFLPGPESYRNLIEKNCTNSLYDPANPEFYKFEFFEVIDGYVTFKSLFSLEATEESVGKFVVLQVGQRAALILASLARIALLQSRFYTALACCRVGLILVRLLNSISSGALWISHQILFFLLAGVAVEACSFLAAFDHLSCCQCTKIMDTAVVVYLGFLNIFRCYGARLTAADEDLMLDGGVLADTRTICLKLETELQFNDCIGYDVQFQISMFYFHMAVKDVTAHNSGHQPPVPTIFPRDNYVALSVKGFEELFDSYMMAAALFCRGCFRSASGRKGPNLRRTKKLVAAERDFLYVLDMSKDDDLQLSSIPWQRLLEKAYLASLVTQCRILVRCANAYDVEHFRNCLNHLYSLVKWRSSSKPDGGSPSSRQYSALACLAFLYLTDHIQGAADVFEDSEKGSLSLRRAKCESQAFRLLKEEATLSFCLKVFSDLSKEKPDGEEDLIDWEVRLRRCLHRLRLLSVPIFAAANSLFSLSEANNTNNTVLVCSNNMEVVSYSRCKLYGLQPVGRRRDSSGLEKTVSSSSSFDTMQCHNRTSKMRQINDNEDSSECVCLDKPLTLSNGLRNESFNGVNSQIGLLSMKMENQFLAEAFKSSTTQSRFKGKDHSCSLKLSSVTRLASLNTEMTLLQNKTTLCHARGNGLVSLSKNDLNVQVDQAFITGSSQHNRISFNEKANSVNEAYSRENRENWSNSPLFRTTLNPLRRRIIIQSDGHQQIENFPRNIPAAFGNANYCSSDRIAWKKSPLLLTEAEKMTDSLKINLWASPNFSECSPSIVDTPKFSVEMKSSSIVAPAVSACLEDTDTTLLDEGFDSLSHRKNVSPKINVFPYYQPKGGISYFANEDWVAEFPPNSTSQDESEQRNFIESKRAKPLGVKHWCAEKLSGTINKSSVLLRKNLFAKGNSYLAPLNERPVSHNEEPLVKEGDDKFNFKSVSRRLPDDTDSWLLFLRWSSRLKTVEDNLDELFLIDGTDDLVCMKNTITEDLQSLCRSIVGNQDNPCPAHLSACAHSACITALRYHKRDVGLAEFYSLLTTLFEALGENPFGSAAFWT